MGTPSYIAVKINGSSKTFYNHWDGYVSGVGNDILNELKDFFNNKNYNEALCILKKQATNLKIVKLDDKPTEDDIQKLMAMGCVDLTVSHQTTNDWYCLTRHNQGSLLKRLKTGIEYDGMNVGGGYYDYILDLDNETFYYTNGEWKQSYMLLDLLKTEKLIDPDEE